MVMETGSGDASPPQRRRAICGGCDRPLPVCLCHVIPTPPIPTASHVVIIQHPHESRHKLNTAALLTKSLLNATCHVGRRVTPDIHPLLALQPPPATYYLFPPTPSSPAVNLSHLKRKSDKSPLNLDSQNAPPVLLIAFDATWRHAREMVSASEGCLSKFGATRVCLDGFDEGVEGGSIYDSELVLRKEPWGGCVSTAEAAARWLAVVEENGAEVADRLVSVLREMVRLQAQFLKPMKPRPKLLKKTKLKNQESDVVVLPN